MAGRSARSRSAARSGSLAVPDSYPEHPSRIEAIETHYSWVFLTDTHAYKLKKPVQGDGFDFRSVAARRRNALAELRLNRRLAPGVYLRIVKLSFGGGWKPGSRRAGRGSRLAGADGPARSRLDVRSAPCPSRLALCRNRGLGASPGRVFCDGAAGPAVGSAAEDPHHGGIARHAGRISGSQREAAADGTEADRTAARRVHDAPCRRCFAGAFKTVAW